MARSLKTTGRMKADGLLQLLGWLWMLLQPPVLVPLLLRVEASRPLVSAQNDLDMPASASDL